MALYVRIDEFGNFSVLKENEGRWRLYYVLRRLRPGIAWDTPVAFDFEYVYYRGYFRTPQHMEI